MNYSRNKKFFKQNLSVKKILAIVALFLILGLVLFQSGLGAIFGILAGIIIVVLISKKPSPDDIIADCMAQVENARVEALDKLGLDESEVNLIAPIVIYGFDYEHNIGDDELGECYWQYSELKNKEKIWITPIFSINVLYFSETEVHMYSKFISMVSTTSKLNTSTYFYKDIVSISTSSKVTVNKKGGVEENITYDIVQLANTGGEKFAFSTMDSAASVTNKINAFRALLRQKKLEK